jgi:beta-lactamase superfamily II metal-dependent hydrolase
MLLTGDGRSDHLISGLDDLGLLDATGSIHVNLLKLPHHGSDRNVTKDFFSKITADIYVVSANGKHGNPDLSTLIWIVETAKEQNRQIEIVATNRTDSTDGLLVNNPPADFGYTLTIMANNQDAFVVDLTA